MNPLACVGPAAHWLGMGALDGGVLAATAGLLSVTLLSRASGRVFAGVWLLVLAEFVVVRPFQMHAVPLHGGVERALEATGAATATSLALPAVVYCAVVLFLLARLLVRQRRLRTCIAGYSRAEPAIAARVRAAGNALSLGVLPEVRVTDAAVGPFIVGPLRPMLVLPRSVCVSGARLDAVLLHELAHLKRRDHWILWFERLVVIVFFFWPPVYWVSRKLDEARELACDELAILRGAFCPAEYGRHLLDVVALGRERLTSGAALAISRSSFRLERRIDRLLEQTWSRRPSSAEGAALLLLGVCSLLGLRPAHASRSPWPVPPIAVAADTSIAEGINMSLDPRLGSSAPPEGGCVLQACGTQCAP